MNDDFVLEPFNSTHDRSEFSCGVDALDTYLRLQASQDMRRYYSGVFILRKANDPHVIGYYTLSALSVALTALPQGSIRRVGGYQQVPATLLGRLAIDVSCRGQHLGQRLLLNAFQRSYHTALEVGSALLVVDALDEHAANFYRHYDFVSFPEQPLRLAISMDVIKKVVRRESPPVDE
jgi:predicted GNAT family N-acyltransferase